MLCMFNFFYVYDMTCIVCVSSNNRATVCNEKTLTNMLKAHDIPKRHICVYVASQEDYDRYKEVLGAKCIYIL